MTANSAPANAPLAPAFDQALARRKLTGTIFYGACLAAIGILLLALIILLADILVRGLPWLNVDFLTGVPSRRPGNAGILPALVGSLEISLIVGLLTFPIGVAAAIYFTEYARDPRTNLGLALFVQFLQLGRTVIAAALTLTLLILPIVIIASIEAIRAVPNAQREGAYALGATRWQMVRRSVLPAAAPSIMTGIILAMARAIGEAAPLLMIGGVGFVTFLPNPVSGAYTVLPLQIFDWAKRPQDDFASISAAAILVILALMLVLNALALVVRARLSRHIQW